MIGDMLTSDFWPAHKVTKNIDSGFHLQNEDAKDATKQQLVDTLDQDLNLDGDDSGAAEEKKVT